MDIITYEVVEEDGIFYVYDSEGRAVASDTDQEEAQAQADKFNETAYVDRAEEAAARADFLYDQERDRRMFGEDF